MEEGVRHSEKSSQEGAAYADSYGPRQESAILRAAILRASDEEERDGGHGDQGHFAGDQQSEAEARVPQILQPFRAGIEP
jgi:hypothetical protein